MFPKFASGTSGKSRENKGSGMADTSDDEDRNLFFKLADYMGSNYTGAKSAIKWGQIRIRYLEQQTKDTLHQLSVREARIAHVQSLLKDADKRIEDLEKENARLTDCLSCAPAVESDEDCHQRLRREEMLDEVTLICVRNRMFQADLNTLSQREFGKISRDAADNILRGINEYDAEH